MTEGEESLRSQAGQLQRLRAAGKGKRGCQKQEELEAPGSVSSPARTPCGPLPRPWQGFTPHTVYLSQIGEGRG